MNTAFKYSFIDGIFAHMFATLTGGVFLTSLALHLGMDPVYIGLLGAMPYLVTIFQPVASIYLERSGKQKRVAIVAAFAARFIWIFILAAAVAPLPFNIRRTDTVLLLILVSYAGVSISYVAWLSWTANLVPADIRGRFFSTRSMFCGIGGLAVMIVFGRLLDWSRAWGPEGLNLGFTATLGAAVLCGMLSLHFLKKVPEAPSIISKGPVLRRMAEPLRQPNFRKFLFYGLTWNFSVYFASPFFTMYFLRDLHFSYSLVAIMAAVSALADLSSATFWGRLADRVRNKPILLLGGWMAVILPVLWSTVKPDSLIFPLCLHIAGGSVWSGILLCSSNMMIHIAPERDRSFYYAINAVVTGLGAGIAPILSGLFLKIMESGVIDDLPMAPIRMMFLISAFMRALSLMLLLRVYEPEEVSVVRMVWILRSVRGLNTANGFANLLHPLVQLGRARQKNNRP